MTGCNGSRLGIRNLSTTTIQACQNRDRETCIQINSPLRQHCAATFVTCVHIYLYNIAP